MSRNKGIASFSANFEPQVAAPLDARMLVPTKAELLLAATWQANDGGVYSYVGMIVCVYADSTPANNGLYRLTAADYTQASNWTMAGGSGGTGDFSGPGSAVSGALLMFAGTSGKQGADSGVLASSLVTGAMLTDAIDVHNADAGAHSGTFDPAGTANTAVSNHDSSTGAHASLLSSYQQTAYKGVSNGYASLGADGKVPTGQLPSMGGTGDFIGPGSSVSGNFVSFSNTDGKHGQDSGYSPSSFATSGAITSAVSAHDASTGAHATLLSGYVTSGSLSAHTSATGAAVHGLGNASTRNVGTTAGTVAEGDDSRFHVAATVGTGLSLSGQRIFMPDSGVTAGSYSLPGITVDAQGRITTALSKQIATVALAKAKTGSAGDVIYITDKHAWYQYESNCTVTADDDLTLTTGDGGDTRWRMSQKASRYFGDTGWINRDNATISALSSTTVRLALSSAAELQMKGVCFELAAGNYDCVLSGSAGLRYIGFNDTTGTLTSQASIWDFATQIPVAIASWSGTAIVTAPQTEMHGLRDAIWHYSHHFEFGLAYASGLNFTGSVQTDNNTNPADDTTTFLWSTTGHVVDEDLDAYPGTGQWAQTLGSGLTTTTAAIIPHQYWDGSKLAAVAAMSDRAPFIHGGGNTTPQWNNAGTLTASVTGDYIVYHYFATPRVGGWSVFARPHNAKFTSLTAAQAARPSQLTWDNYAEIKHIYSAVWRVNTTQFSNATHRAKLVALYDYRMVAASPSASSPTSDHQSLNNRDVFGAHPWFAIDLTTATEKTTPLDADTFAAYSAADAAPRKVTFANIKAAMGGGTGDFIGPASSVSGNFVSFTGTDGKHGADSGVNASSFVTSGALSAYQAVSGKGVSNGYAGLDSFGKLQTTQAALQSVFGPSGTITEGRVVVMQAATDNRIYVQDSLIDSSALVTTPMLTAYQQTAYKGISNGYASLGSDGKVPSSQLPTAGSGDVTGPSSAVSNSLVIFNSTTGKSIGDSGIAASSLVTSSMVASYISGSTGTSATQLIRNTTTSGYVAPVVGISVDSAGRIVPKLVRVAQTTLSSSSGTATWDVQDNQTASFTPSEAITAWTVSNISEGCYYGLILVAGANAITWTSSIFKGMSGYGTASTGTKRDHLTFRGTGSNTLELVGFAKDISA